LLDSVTVAAPNLSQPQLLAQMYAMIGQPNVAVKMYEAMSRAAHTSNANTSMQSDSAALHYSGDEARAFSWHHALLADAIAETADTLTLLAIADSLDQRSTRSYYGRDWKLAHHVRGLVA